MFEPEVIKKLLNPRNLESLKLSKVDLEAMELYEDLGGKFTRYLYRCKAENGQEWLVEIPKTSCPVKTNELPNFDTYPEWSQYSRAQNQYGYCRNNLLTSWHAKIYKAYQ